MPQASQGEQTMPVVSREEVLPGTPEELFDLTQNYSLRAAWDPFPESYEFHNMAGPALGCEVTVRAKNGFRMRVRYVAFDRPSAAAIEMVTGPWFFRRFAGTWRFLPESPGKTRVVFKYNVLARPGLLAPLLNAILARSFARHARARLLSLKACVEGKKI